MSNVVIQGFPSSGAFTQADIRGYKSYAASIVYDKEENFWVVKQLYNDLGFDMNWQSNNNGQFAVYLNSYTPMINLLGIADKILCFGNPGNNPIDNFKVTPQYDREQNIFTIIGLDDKGGLDYEAFCDTDNYFHASIEIRIYP